MKIITTNDLDQFMSALGKLQEKAAALKKLTTDANTVMLMTTAADHPETGLAIGITAGSKILQEQEEMYADFETHAEKCLGERRKHGESGKDLFDRIAALSENKLVATMQRNGIRIAA